ncbi:uridine kinase [Sedimentitalea sp. XS_ASV28]|uniref:uridine kinase family protein n=1 Tax=Sedimentitalea sp. XS_ASV28 TaxID=3241296 RepID=UPI0035182899
MSPPSDKNVESLIRAIVAKRYDVAGPFLVAIDGRSGAGKSTLARTIAHQLNAPVISGDDFFSGGEGILDDPADVLAEICIDWRALRKVLEKLHATENASFFPYDWGAFDGSKSSKETYVEPSEIVVIEGVYAARPELRDLLDLTVLIEVPDEERLKRLIKREGGLSAWEQQWHRAEDWYFENLAPPHSFDLLLSDAAVSP